MSSKSAGKLKDEILEQIGEQIKALQLGQQTVDDAGHTDGYVVTVKNIHLQCLLDLLDHILLLGLHDVEFGYWPFVSKFTHSETIRLIAEHPQVTNDLDKGRVWVYMAISDGLLESYIRAFTDGQKVAKKFYTRHSFIRDKERLSVLLTLVSGLDFINITLDQCTVYRSVKLHTRSFTVEFSPYLGYGTFDPNPSAVDVTGSARTEEIFITTNRRKGSTSTASSFSNASTITAPLSPTSPTASEYDSSDTVTGPDDAARQRERNTVASDLETGNIEEGFQTQKPAASKYTIENKFNFEPNRDSETNVIYFNEPGIADYGRTTSPRYSQFDNINAGGFKGDMVTMDEVDVLYHHHQRKPRKGSKKVTGIEEKDEENSGNETEQERELDHSDDAPPQAGRDEKQKNQQRVETARQDSSASGHSAGSEGLHVGSPGSLTSSIASGDSMDQFCRDFDASSLNDSSMEEATVQLCQNELTTSLEERDVLFGAKSSEKASEVPLSSQTDASGVTARKQTSAEYEGIILGLPRRPIISDVNCSSADISVDQNTLLMLSLEIFQKNGEQLQRVLRLWSGHQSGLPRSAYVAVTDQAIYVMRRVPSQAGWKFKTENIFAVSNTTKIEIGLNFQTIVFRAKTSGCVLTTCDEAVARSLMSTITTLLLKSNQPSPLSGIVSNSHIQQEMRIKKWMIETDDNVAADAEITCFSLVHWSCFAGPDSFLELMSFQSVKEGYLDCKGHNVLGMTTRWIQGYFVLTNGNLHQYNSQDERHAKLVLNLKNSRCGGCRRLHDADRPFAFEIVSFSGAPLLILATESENEASDWIYRLCQTIADSFDTKEEMGCRVTRCIPCCVIATKHKVVTCLEDESNRYRFLSSCPIQGISKLYVDNEYKTYCILKFDYGDVCEVEATWFVWFRTEYELGKFERAVAEAWKGLFQVDLQFLVLGDCALRKKAREHVGTIETMYAS